MSVYLADISVGAYLSSKMVLLYGQPVIQMESWLEMVVAGKPAGRRGPAMIRRNTSDISITTCFRFSDSIDTQSISKQVHIRIYHEWPYRVKKITQGVGLSTSDVAC